MGHEQLVRQGQKEIENSKQPLSERELLIQILKLQMMLNSKLFEFIRGYQAHHNWGEHGMFRDGDGSKTRTARLLDEVNNIGFTLNEMVSVFIGENLYEKRDKDGRVLAHCNRCQKETPFIQMIASPYGLAGAYLDGTERLACSICQIDTIYPGDSRLPKFNSVFRTK